MKETQNTLDVPDELSTTTVSDISPLAQFFLCSSSSLPLSKFHLPYRKIDEPGSAVDIVFTRGVLDDAYRIRSVRNSQILRRVTSLCRTSRLETSVIAKCIPAVYTDVEEMTCGGMSRIYSAKSVDNTEPPVVVKTTDCSRGLGLYEYDSYMMLARKNFQIPSIHYVAMYSNYLIIILSRHSFSLSSLLLALAGRNSPGDLGMLESIMHNIRHLLYSFRLKNITYCDFSPDNIMIDVDPGTLTGKFVLIDPQFAVHTSRLSNIIGHNWVDNIDRVHFAYKVRALAIQEPSMQNLAYKVCTEFLGYVPSPKHTKRWILNVLPDGLRIAYECIRRDATHHARALKKNSRKGYGQKCNGCW